MRVISIGTRHTDKFVSEISSFKKYVVEKIANDDSAVVKMPAFEKHEEAEVWAENNIVLLKSFLSNTKEKHITFVVSQNFESGIFLVLLQLCNELQIKVDVILIRRDFGLPIQEKVLSKVLYGVLYEFLNKGIDNIFYFYFDMFRKIIPDINIVNDSLFYKKIALLWHKRNVFLHKPSFMDLTGEVKWGIQQVNNIMSLPKLVLLSSQTINDTILNEIGVEIFRMTYYISYSEEKVEENVENYIKEVSHVVRDFKFYTLGEDVLFELFVRPISGN